MTTVGVDPEKPERVDALPYPSYNYHYWAFKNKQRGDFIAECNRGPPNSYRRVAEERRRQENECRRLEIAAVPGTTPTERGLCTNQDLPRIVPAPARPDFVARARIRPLCHWRWTHETTPVVTSRTRDQWSDFLHRSPERFDIQLPLEGHGETGKPYYDGGYALRYLRPHLTRGLGMERWVDRPFGYLQGPATDSPYRDIVISYALAGK